MACTGITDSQYINAANAQGDFEVENAKTNRYIAGGVLAAQILLRNYVSSKSDEIKSRQLTIAETLRGQLKKYWEIQKSLLTESCAAAVPTTDYSIANQFSGYIAKPDCDKFGVSCINVDPCTKNATATAIAIAKVDAANFGMRYAENKQRAYDEQRFARRFKTLQSIRGIYAGADRLIDHAGAISGYTSLAGIITSGLRTAGNISKITPIIPTYVGQAEYTWNGNLNVPASQAPFVISTTAPVQPVVINNTVTPQAAPENMKDSSIDPITGKITPYTEYAAENQKNNYYQRGK